MTSRIFDDDRMSSAAAVAGVGLAIGFGLAALSRRRARHARPSDAAAAHGRLTAYLREHLSASDAALAVVGRLRQASERGEIRGLADALERDFAEERDALRILLASIGASGHSPKRVAGRAVGSVLGPMAGGRPGEMSLLRTIEGLAVGVQGKRLLWRALRAAFPTHEGPNGRTFVELEAMALSQWEAIEAVRQSLARATFQPEGSFRRADRRLLPI
jgi:hypothetical protein